VSHGESIKRLTLFVFCIVQVQSVLLVLLDRESNKVEIAGFGIFGISSSSSSSSSSTTLSVAADEGSTSNQS